MSIPFEAYRAYEAFRLGALGTNPELPEEIIIAGFRALYPKEARALAETAREFLGPLKMDDA